ncbi:unnamed protein product [Amoebophrya sp. A25]|nr:unnamed protein product [Amoebophrya sp. A25]|eukprot:GSA25T00015666001.1
MSRFLRRWFSGRTDAEEDASSVAGWFESSSDGWFGSTTQHAEGVSSYSSDTYSYGLTGLSDHDAGVPMIFYGEDDASTTSKKSIMSTLQIIIITSFNFPFGALCGPMGVAILPLEAERLAPERSGLMLGFMMGIVGITQLVCPFAGVVSDAHASRLGKRRPFLLLGGMTTIVSLVGLWFSSLHHWPVTYAIWLFIAMSGLNVAYTAAYGLVPDLVPHEQQGLASGVVGANQLFGSLIAFIFLILTYSFDYHVNYFFYILLLSASIVMTLLVAKEEDTSKDEVQPFTWKQLALSYTIDCSQSYDFLWVFIGRTFYYIGISVQSFVLFYVRDVINVEEVGQQKIHVGAMALSAQFVGGIVAVNAGSLSDGKLGRKFMVYVACAIMAAVYMMFLATPWFFSNEIRFYLNHLQFDHYFKRFIPMKHFKLPTSWYPGGAAPAGAGEASKAARRTLMIQEDDHVGEAPSDIFYTANAVIIEQPSVAQSQEKASSGLVTDEPPAENRRWRASPRTSPYARETQRDSKLLLNSTSSGTDHNAVSCWRGIADQVVAVEGQRIPQQSDDTLLEGPSSIPSRSLSNKSHRRMNEKPGSGAPMDLLEGGVAPGGSSTTAVAFAAVAGNLAESVSSSSSSSSSGDATNRGPDHEKAKDEDKDNPETGVFNLAGNSPTTQGMEIMFLYGCMCVYGIGNGAYLAVDLALALDCLPNAEAAAQSLGIWGVSAFLGLAVGPLLWGGALEMSGGKTLDDGVRVYPYTGYAYMLLGGCIFCYMSGYVVSFIKKST